MEETVTIPRSEYETLKKQNEVLSQNYQKLLDQFRLAQKHRFCSSSEKNKTNQEPPEQLRLEQVFNEAEAIADELPQKEATGKEITVQAHKRKQYVTNLDNLPKNVEVEIINNDLPESEKVCPECGSDMVKIGENIDRKIKFKPAKFIIVETRTPVYKCKTCRKPEDEQIIVRAELPKPVIPNGNATAEAIAYIATEKYLMYSPLYRLEQQINMAGIPLTRQTMSNWLLTVTELYFDPIWKRMHEKLLEETILHADETTLQVLHEPNRKPQSKSQMWLYRTGKYSKQQLVLYDYRETRQKKHPQEFLSGFKGYLQTDGYSGYQHLSPDIKDVGCMAHARREFVEALELLPKDVRNGSVEMQAVAYFDKLFAYEESFSKMTPDERKAKRLEYSKPVLDELYTFAQKANVPPNRQIGKAFQYLLGQWKWLTVWLEDGRLEISNNRAERSIKPFVMGRKNFLFCNTQRGAHSSAVIYSMIETAKENALDPFLYLTWLLKRAPYLNLKSTPDIDKLLPENAPSDCYSKKI